MDAITIRFDYDYVDPGSYLAAELLRRWWNRRGVVVSIEWSPLELRVPGADAVAPDDPVWSSMTRTLRHEAEEAGIPFETPWHIPFSRKAHELALHAHEKGCFDAVHRALFEAHFVEGRDIGRVDVLVDLGEALGLDPSETRTVLGVDRFLPHLETLRAEALEHGVRGVPTLESRGRRLEGVESRAALEAFLEDVRTEPATAEPDHDR